MNTEKVKVGLLGLIALTLIVNTYYLAVGSSSDLPEAQPSGDWQGSAISTSTQGGAQNNAAAGGMNDANPFVSGQQLNAGANNPTLNAMPNANNGTPTPPASVTNIKFANDFKDFGTVKAQSENTYAFEFVNTGNEPLLIENAKGSCGCTVPDWPRSPILPGQKGKIDVVFKPKNRETKGEDKKTVTVFANTNPKTTVLTVRATVEP